MCKAYLYAAEHRGSYNGRLEIFALLPIVDFIVLIVYLAAVVLLGCFFVRKSGGEKEFTMAGGSIPGWAVGLSIFGTFLSSNTFLGNPGKAYGSNWNSLVFSFTLPLAALIAVMFFVPFYRRSGEVSAYAHLEKRFGVWARTYAVVCYLLTQVARMGTILYGVSLGLSALTGWPVPAIILGTGVLVTVYTLLGGIEAVIWTDVVQSIVLMAGALLIAGTLLLDMPEGPGQVFSIGMQNAKFSLGSFSLNPLHQPGALSSTFWMVLLFGVFINLTNFGIDQSFVQRYHTAKSDRAAANSVWFGALLYVPISILFFFIGTSLFAWAETHPEHRVAVQTEAFEAMSAEKREELGVTTASQLKPHQYGDKVLPYFIVNGLPPGVAGLLLAAIFAAAMSSIDTSLNSSATVMMSDIYKRYFRPDAQEKEVMRVLYSGTILCGVVGTTAALAMIGAKSILDVWWKLSGVFAGGMLGLFLLGIILRSVRNSAAAVAVVLGVLVVMWLALSPGAEWLPAYLQNPLDTNLNVVIGTLTIFFAGALLSMLLPQPRKEPEKT